MAQEHSTQWEIPPAQETGYNGWTNWETWCVTLWLNNDSPATSDYLYELSNRKHNAPHILADILREQVNAWWHDLVELHELPSASMWADLMTGTLQNVDWDGIIDAHRELD
jgi:hypothetical protein